MASFVKGAVHPFFLHAIGRQEKAEKIAKMVVNLFLHSNEPVPQNVANEIQRLHRQGKSTGKIIELIYDKHDICYYGKRIRNIIRNRYR